MKDIIINESAKFINQPTSIFDGLSIAEIKRDVVFHLELSTRSHILIGMYLYKIYQIENKVGDYKTLDLLK